MFPAGDSLEGPIDLSEFLDLGRPNQYLVGGAGIERWLPFDKKLAFLAAADILMVDVLYRGLHDLTEITCRGDGQTVTGNGFHIREGIVITPVVERSERRFGRVILKDIWRTTCSARATSRSARDVSLCRRRTRGAGGENAASFGLRIPEGCRA